MARRGSTVTKIVYNKFPEIVRKLPTEAMEIVGETLEEIDVTVQTGMAAGGTGEFYIRQGISHQASAPGEMPAKDLGILAGSLQQEIDQKEYKGYYYTTNDYSIHLEYGTRFMAARPFMTPAAEKARAPFMRKLRRLEDRLR